MLNEYTDRAPEPERSRITDRRFWIAFVLTTAAIYLVPAVVAWL